MTRTPIFGRPGSPGGPGRRALGAVALLYVATALLVTWQRGAPASTHTTFKIFRQSFRHLAAGANLYAHYPAEQGAAAADLFKYSPTAALLFAPFAVAPYSLALLAWSLLGALLLLLALSRVLPPGASALAAVLVYPDLLASMQGVSSNALVAALIVLAFAAFERREQTRAAVWVVIGTAIKLFPAAALLFGVFQPRRRRQLLIVGGLAMLALLLPLAVTSPVRLAAQYHWWAALERSDANDLRFGMSAMRLTRHWVGGRWPNWWMQVGGTIALIVPFLRRRNRWGDHAFRHQALASVLMYAVLFNHQAERSSFVIASAGVAIWCLVPGPGGSPRRWRFGLGLPALLGLGSAPLLAAWAALQLELHRWPDPPVVAPAPSPSRSTPVHSQVLARHALSGARKPASSRLPGRERR